MLDPQTWSYLPETDPAGIAREFARLFETHRPRLVLFGAPDNPTSQVLPQSLADVMRAKTAEAGAWLAIDFAYKCQYFQTPPEYYAWSPADHPNVVGIHSNSKWARGLGRRLGWVEAHASVVDALERVQQCSILCPDTLSQMTMARYLKTAIGSGSLRRYVDYANAIYKKAAQVTVNAVDTHLQRPRLAPAGGLYTVVDIGTNAEEFVPRALKPPVFSSCPARASARHSPMACASRLARLSEILPRSKKAWHAWAPGCEALTLRHASDPAPTPRHPSHPYTRTHLVL